MATCHPERKHSAFGLCRSCHLRHWRSGNSEKAKAYNVRSYAKNAEQQRMRARKLREEHPEEYAARNRQSYYKYKERRIAYQNEWMKRDRSRALILCQRYGAPEVEVERVLAIPMCEVCGSTENLNVDHNHRSGVLRGRLCKPCNWVVGRIDDSVERCQKIIEYLERYQATEFQSYLPRMDLRTVTYKRASLGPTSRRKAGVGSEEV